MNWQEILQQANNRYIKLVNQYPESSEEYKYYNWLVSLFKETVDRGFYAETLHALKNQQRKANQERDIAGQKIYAETLKLVENALLHALSQHPDQEAEYIYTKNNYPLLPISKRRSVLFYDEFGKYRGKKIRVLLQENQIEEYYLQRVYLGEVLLENDRQDILRVPFSWILEEDLDNLRTTLFGDGHYIYSLTDDQINTLDIQSFVIALLEEAYATGLRLKQSIANNAGVLVYNPQESLLAVLENKILLNGLQKFQGNINDANGELLFQWKIYRYQKDQNYYTAISFLLTQHWQFRLGILWSTIIEQVFDSKLIAKTG